MSISRPTDGMGVFCTRCNAEMEPDATFCPNCGEPRLLAGDTVVSRGEPTQVIEETIVDEPPLYVEDRPTVPPWLAALVGVLATLVVVLVIVLFARNDDNKSGDTTTAVPTTIATTIPAPTAPSIVTIPVPVVVTPAPAPTNPPTTQPPATTTPPTTAAP